jgi:hypothetical protein
MFNRVKAVITSVALVFTSICLPLGNVSAAAQATGSDKWSRGVNLYCWYDKKAYNSLPVIQKYGYDSVCLDWTTSIPAKRLNDYLTECDKLGLTPTVCLWDANGKSDMASLEKCALYWMQEDVQAVFKKHPTASIKVAEGWDPGSFEVWSDAYASLLPKIRDGFDGNIIITTPSKPEDDKIMARCAETVRNSLDRKKFYVDLIYLIWNHHGSVSMQDIRDYVWDMGGIGCEVIITYRGSTYPFDELFYRSSSSADSASPKEIINYCKQNNIGVYAFTWCGDTSAQSSLNLTSDWVNYTDRGKAFDKLLFS